MIYVALFLLSIQQRFTIFKINNKFIIQYNMNYELKILSKERTEASKYQ